MCAARVMVVVPCVCVCRAVGSGAAGGLGRPTFRGNFIFLVLVGSHRTSSEAWSYLGFARAVAHSYERERGVVRDTI